MDILNYLQEPMIAWFIIGLILLILEFSLPGLIMGFFGVGAWVTALVCSIVDLSLTGQLLTFIIFSVLAITLLRKRIKEKFFGESSNKEDVLSDEFIGKKSVAITEISVVSGGKVTLKGAQWEAKSDVDIKKGENVEIIGRENIVLRVKPVSQ